MKFFRICVNKGRMFEKHVCSQYDDLRDRISMAYWGKWKGRSFNFRFLTKNNHTNDNSTSRMGRISEVCLQYIRCEWEDYIKVDLAGIVWERMDWICMVCDRCQWRNVAQRMNVLRVPYKEGKFMTKLSSFRLSRILILVTTCLVSNQLISLNRKESCQKNNFLLNHFK
jgi:hypothetical protein